MRITCQNLTANGPKEKRSISRRIRFVFYQSKCEVTIRLVVFEKKTKMFVSLLSLFVFVQLDYSDQSDWSPH